MVLSDRHVLNDEIRCRNEIWFHNGFGIHIELEVGVVTHHIHTICSRYKRNVMASSNNARHTTYYLRQSELREAEVGEILCQRTTHPHLALLTQHQATLGSGSDVHDTKRELDMNRSG